MPDIYLPAAAGAYAVVITAWPGDDDTDVTYPAIVAWRIQGGRPIPVFVDGEIEEGGDDPMIWLPDHDGQLRSRVGIVGTVAEARLSTLSHAYPTRTRKAVPSGSSSASRAVGSGSSP